MTEKKPRSFADLVNEVARTVEPPQPPAHLALPAGKQGRMPGRWLLPTLAASLVLLAIFYLTPDQDGETATSSGLSPDRVVIEHLTIGGVSASVHVLPAPGTDALIIDARSQAKSTPNGRDPQNVL